MDKVEAACESAKQNPGEENSFRQLHLNQWMKQAVRWMLMEKWDACAYPINEEMPEGRVCYGGLDLSSTTDLTSFCLVFPPEEEDEPYYVLLTAGRCSDGTELRRHEIYSRPDGTRLCQHVPSNKGTNETDAGKEAGTG